MAYSGVAHFMLLVSILTHHPLNHHHQHAQTNTIEWKKKQSIDWTEVKRSVLVRVSVRQRRRHTSIRATVHQIMSDADSRDTQTEHTHAAIVDLI